jgi:hypothetical protein
MVKMFEKKSSSNLLQIPNETDRKNNYSYSFLLKDPNQSTETGFENFHTFRAGKKFITVRLFIFKKKLI